MTDPRRVALVTGASRGIGKQAAIALAARGFHVVITARTVHEGDATTVARDGRTVVVPGSLDSTTTAIHEAGGSCEAVPMDLLDTDSVDAVLAHVHATHGALDVVVNNAVYQGPGPMMPLLELTPEQALTTITGNYLQQLRIVQGALPAMLERGAGAIVGVTSHTATHDPRFPVGRGGWGLGYAASKAAFHRIAGIVHAEHGHQGIRAYNVDPGHVLTEKQIATGSGKVFEDAGYRGTGAEVPGAVIAWLADGRDPAAVELAGSTVIAARVHDRAAGSLS